MMRREAEETTPIKKAYVLLADCEAWILTCGVLPYLGAVASVSPTKQISSPKLRASDVKFEEAGRVESSVNMRAKELEIGRRLSQKRRPPVT
ncbi:hypothetical protein K1719_031702 [Acacia pycnantha]|nr:hypothetical protein K1719_031702 [Acacia pycnantha]